MSCGDVFEYGMVWYGTWYLLIQLVSYSFWMGLLFWYIYIYRHAHSEFRIQDCTEFTVDSYNEGQTL